MSAGSPTPEPPTPALPTPYLRVDVDRLRANVERAAGAAATAGVALRPHAKTHKSVDVARLQLEAGAAGLTVATVGEAEAFAEAGVGDLFVAYPLWLTDALADRLRALADAGVRLAIGVDSVRGAQSAGRLLAGSGVEVVVEVDSGHHRSGCDPRLAGDVAAAAAGAIGVRGVFTFPGHSYSPDGRASAARDEAQALATARASLESAGLAVAVASGGSTPSLAHTETTVLDEVRPGVYVFGDAQQWELGSMPADDIALTAVATVVSHAGGRLVLDAGSKVLGADRAAYATGFGRLLEHPDARLVQLSEHHAVAELPGPLPALGSRVLVVPNHCCTAVNLADVLVPTVGGTPWPVTARGRNG
ncbi:D-serine deaminase-like pyridoxal phosphate-dependent protein [Nocardioides cavernae]|uniref:D-serine deaminase-like pyridoxal phosphate-dependent protein n=1 Tax=Nocardioides cavernae TaxID=1921566 RepID=A0A7Y9H0W6_9ACTN|nr:alanine racemase [Nocardioides cavernae]NYE35718.1 D-serine deaminase-like pyridoxal phosphate-dependent protein [Nocardioides cavernae]